MTNLPALFPRSVEDSGDSRANFLPVLVWVGWLGVPWRRWCVLYDALRKDPFLPCFWDAKPVCLLHLSVSIWGFRRRREELKRCFLWICNRRIKCRSQRHIKSSCLSRVQTSQALQLMESASQSAGCGKPVSAALPLMARPSPKVLFGSSERERLFCSPLIFDCFHLLF